MHGQLRQWTKELSLFLLLYAVQLVFPPIARAKSLTNLRIYELITEKGSREAIRALRQRLAKRKKSQRGLYNLIPVLDAASEHYIKNKDYVNAIWYQKEALSIDREYSSTAILSKRYYRLADLYLLAGKFDLFMLFMKNMFKDLVGPGSPVDGNLIYQKMIDECKKRGLIEKQISLLEDRYRWRKGARYKGEVKSREFEAHQHAILARELLALKKKKRAAKAIRIAENLSGMSLPLTCTEAGFLDTYLIARDYYRTIGDKRKVNFLKERIWELGGKKPVFTEWSLGKIKGHCLAIPGYRDIPHFQVHKNYLFIVVPNYRINKIRTSLVLAYDLLTHKRLWQQELFTHETACIQMGCCGDHLALLLPEALQVLNILNGKELWRRAVGENGGSLYVSQGKVIFCHHRRRRWSYTSSDVLSCYDLATGAFCWHRKTTGPSFGEMSVDKDKLFVTVAAKRLLALSLKDCKPIWQRNGSFVAAPILHQDKLYTMTENSVNNHTFELPTIVNSKSGSIDFKSSTLSFLAKHFSRESIIKKTLFSAREAHKIQLRKRDEILRRLKKEVLTFPNKKAITACRQVLLERIANYEKRGKSLFLSTMQLPYQRNLRYGSIKWLRLATKKIPPHEVTARDIRHTAYALIRLWSGDHKKLRRAISALKDNSRIMNAIIRVNNLKPLQDSGKKSKSTASQKVKKAKTNIFLLPRSLRDARSIMRLSKIELTRPAPTDQGLAYTTGNIVKHFTLDLQRTNWLKLVKGTKGAPRPLTQPSYANACLFVCTTDGRLLVFDSQNGQEKLQLRLGEPITHPPFVDAKRKHVVVLSDFGSLFHLDMSSVMSP